LEVKTHLCGRGPVFEPLPFACESFERVVFDAGEARADGLWRAKIATGFCECFRVLRPNGSLVFEWRGPLSSVREVLALSPEKPVLGATNARTRTHWALLLKPAR